MSNSDTALRKAPNPKRQRPAPLPEAFAYSVEEVRQMGGPGRTKVYELVKTGELELIHIAGISRITGRSVRRLLRVHAD
jgi:hypothetical protein